MTKMFVVLMALYFVPAIVAFARGHQQKVAITLLNLFLGWSVIGWVGALVWSVMKRDNRQRGPSTFDAGTSARSSQGAGGASPRALAS